MSSFQICLCLTSNERRDRAISQSGARRCSWGLAFLYPLRGTSLLFRFEVFNTTHAQRKKEIGALDQTLTGFTCVGITYRSCGNDNPRRRSRGRTRTRLSLRETCGFGAVSRIFLLKSERKELSLFQVLNRPLRDRGITPHTSNVSHIVQLHP